MKAKVSVVIVLAFAIAVFFAGWVQFAVPAGKFGVLVSKTGGVDPVPLVPGRFRWQWERLLPTNARVIAFDLSPVTVSIAQSGTLPSGELYSKMLEGDPDFSWSVSVQLTGRVDVDRLPSLVGDGAFVDQAGLESWTKARLDAAGTGSIQLAMSAIASRRPDGSDPNDDPDPFGSALRESLSSSDGVEILESAIMSRTLPDVGLYALASETYAAYQTERRELFAKTSAREADASVSEYLQIERFGRWGELLTKYPILIDFLAVSKDDAGQAFKAVRELSGQ